MTHRLEVPIPGVRVSIPDGVLHIRSERPLRVLSSAACGGAWLTTGDILNLHVSKGYSSERPEDDLQAAAARLGVPEPFVGLMTAAYVERARMAYRAGGTLVVTCVATVGLTNATSAGRESPWLGPPPPGTINLVLLVDADLAPEAMVNLVITATEAKTLALVEQGQRTLAGELASGTSTDAVVIACTGEGPRYRYAGPATLVGHLAAQCVREAMAASRSV
ncbi:MAG: adenosylcobinamide amidohydrolase [Chloroflexi bacterium]|nr:adenosylcobinamide amidohydrolase [Chloroflexota bacterium]